MKLFYARSAELCPKGAKFRNIRLFSGTEPRVSLVYLAEPVEAIRTAYEAKGVEVVRLDTVAPPADPAAEFAPVETVTIPGDWRELPFGKPDERGYSLREIAEQISACPIKSKAQAVRVIDDYLIGTARPDDADEPVDAPEDTGAEAPARE